MAVLAVVVVASVHVCAIGCVVRSHHSGYGVALEGALVAAPAASSVAAATTSTRRSVVYSAKFDSSHSHGEPGRGTAPRDILL